MAVKSNIMNSAKNKALINKWSNRIAMTEKVHGKALNLEKRVALANSLENTNKQLRMVEATQPGHIGQYKRYALDIVNAVVPNLIAYDLVAVQPIDNRVGMINYINYEYGRTKGQTQKDTMFASSLNMGVSDPNYTTNRVDMEIVGAAGATEYTTNVAWTPVLPGTVSIMVEGEVITADAEGNFAGTNATGTIDHATGEINVTTTATTTQDVVVSYNYNNENAPIENVPEVQLRINSLPVIAQSRKMKAVYAFDAAYELEKEYGQDIDSLLATEVAGEVAHEIDMEIANDLLKMANAGTPVVWSKTQPTGVNNIDHYDSFYTKLVSAMNTIFGATRRVKANFMICGLNVASVCEVMRNFTPSGSVEVGPHFIGTLGSLKVYVNPDYDPNEFVLGYKGGSFMDAGYFYCPYMPIVSTDLIMLSDFAGQKGWATMYAKKMVNNKMYIRGKITD